MTQFLLLQFQRPGDEVGPMPVAVLLLDSANDKLYVRCREDYASIADPDDIMVLDETMKALQIEARAGSGSVILKSLEDVLSNSIRLTDRISLRTLDIAETLDHLAAALIS